MEGFTEGTFEPTAIEIPEGEALEGLVADNPTKKRFEVGINGNWAVLTYETREGVVDLQHLIVPRRIREHGVATALTKIALARIRERGLEVIPTCPFVKAYLKKHETA